MTPRRMDDALAAATGIFAALAMVGAVTMVVIAAISVAPWVLR